MAGGRARNGEVLIDLFLKLDAIVLPLVSLFYPAFASWNAIKSKSSDLMCKWLTYWVAYAAICMIESMLGGPFEWLPLWRYMKIVATGWLSMLDGVTQIRENFVESFSAGGAATRFRENFNESVAGGRSAVAGLMGSTNRVESRMPFGYDHRAGFYNRHRSNRVVIPETTDAEEGPGGVHHHHQHNAEKVETKQAEPAAETPGDHDNGQPKMSRAEKYAHTRMEKEKHHGRKPPPETSRHGKKKMPFIRWESGRVIEEDAF